MIDKQIAENKIDAEQEVQLYLSILKRQGKNAEALEFLEGDLGKKIYPGAPVELKIELLKSLERWGECNVLLKDLLRDKYVRRLIVFIECSKRFVYRSFQSWSLGLPQRLHFVCDQFEAIVIDIRRSRLYVRTVLRISMSSACRLIIRVIRNLGNPLL